MHKSDILIDSPCDADWDSMTGDGRRRFCDSCRKHVHYLSSMTRGEVVDLLRENANQRMCFRYIHDAEGNILFSDDERLAWKRELSAEFVIPASRLVRAKRALAMAVVTPFAAAGCYREHRLMTGAAGCPDLSSIEAVQRADLAQYYDLDPQKGDLLSRTTQAAVHLRRLATTLDDELRTACGNISGDLGGRRDFKVMQNACTEALDSLRIAREKLGQGATLRVDLTPPVCVTYVAQVARCVAACERKNVLPETSFSCQGKTYCAGQCQGTCEREGSVSPLLASDCKGGCSGPCEGVTSCDGLVQTSGASPECQASCEAEALASTQCFPTRLDVHVTNAENTEMATILTETLRKNLGAIAVISLSKKERLERLVALTSTIFKNAREMAKYLDNPQKISHIAVCNGVFFHEGNPTNQRVPMDIRVADDITELVLGREPVKSGNDRRGRE